jgi:hypothetical protein
LYLRGQAIEVPLTQTAAKAIQAVRRSINPAGYRCLILRAQLLRRRVQGPCQTFNLTGRDRLLLAKHRLDLTSRLVDGGPRVLFRLARHVRALRR